MRCSLHQDWLLKGMEGRKMQRKYGVPYSKIMKNFKMVAAGYYITCKSTWGLAPVRGVLSAILIEVAAGSR